MFAAAPLTDLKSFIATYTNIAEEKQSSNNAMRIHGHSMSAKANKKGRNQMTSSLSSFLFL